MRENVEKLLFESGLSGYKIAKESGVPQSTVSRFLTGESKLDNMKLITVEMLNDYYIKLKEENKMENFKSVGTWWNSKDIELVEIAGNVYALNGWNGETYTECWKCTGEDYMDASEEEYIITPIYADEADEFDVYEIVGYELR